MASAMEELTTNTVDAGKRKIRMGNGVWMTAPFTRRMCQWGMGIYRIKFWMDPAFHGASLSLWIVQRERALGLGSVPCAMPQLGKGGPLGRIDHPPGMYYFECGDELTPTFEEGWAFHATGTIARGAGRCAVFIKAYSKTVETAPNIRDRLREAVGSRTPARRGWSMPPAPRCESCGHDADPTAHCDDGWSLSFYCDCGRTELEISWPFEDHTIASTGDLEALGFVVA